MNEELLNAAIAEAYKVANEQNKRQDDEEPEQITEKVPE